MTVDTSDMLKSIFDTFSGLDYIRPEDIPNIDLYMDQVTTFMEEHLKKTRRHPGDKILTKTMINNYAKNDLLPPPTKKKYSREHMLVLIFIYYFKNLLSITDIQALLKPLTEKYFKNDKDFGMEEVYKEVFSLEKGELEKLQKDMEEKYAVSKETFKGAPEEDREFLQLFSFICILAFDTYMKKTLIEKLVDSLNS
ncbi:MAG: DUF1836 domain-containing protein [Lachnospiraceae bacterium]|uniref:DUF1836 domain-containing protein n=1 Tax=Blautia sp. OF03-15BH TaxID=2292287 RepID=UPI0008233D89|nr:DUF1836 domain-containing protein [Blautia sp. OF03-15BH]MBD9014614.1 DUF1836 domain-containing protein [Lachnospiraceae bacterium]MCI5859747.1 DUF1836 domain-containing protein [Blautia sp.]MDY2898404.1 DUF1836 domain-containing protein [Candidatus Limivivens sp.]SCG87666.1 Domain of uncharacterised function (DUF1836) [uncultured Clostridium sp.]MDD5966030.1 DUF1836 domain-containing protein [Blautia sp.]